jgi:hypothetical protein
MVGQSAAIASFSSSRGPSSTATSITTGSDEGQRPLQRFAGALTDAARTVGQPTLDAGERQLEQPTVGPGQLDELANYGLRPRPGFESVAQRACSHDVCETWGFTGPLPGWSGSPQYFPSSTSGGRDQGPNILLRRFAGAASANGATCVRDRSLLCRQRAAQSFCTENGPKVPGPSRSPA